MYRVLNSNTVMVALDYIWFKEISSLYAKYEMIKNDPILRDPNSMHHSERERVILQWSLVPFLLYL